MKCEEIKSRLGQVLGGKYSRANSTLSERMAIRNHIASCRACESMVREALDLYRKEMTPEKILVGRIIGAALAIRDDIDTSNDPEVKR